MSKVNPSNCSILQEQALFPVRRAAKDALKKFDRDILPKKRRKPSKRIEETSSSTSAPTDQDVDMDSRNEASESEMQPPQFDSDLDASEMPENNVDDTSDAASSNQTPSQSDQSSSTARIKNGKGDRNKKRQSPEREIFYFSGASGKVISYGQSIRICMKGKRQH